VTENFNVPAEILRKSSTILDLLNHEVTTTMSADRTLRKLEKVMLHPKVLENLTFEQLITYMDRLMRRQKEGRDFIIDFYRVTSKSQDIQSALKQYTMVGTEGDQVIDGEVVPAENELEIKKSLIAKLDQLLVKRKAEKES
jgi:hypothetical protein